MTHPHQTHTPPGALAKFKSFIPEAESLIQRIQSADVTDTDRQRARALVTEMTGLYQQNKGKTKWQGQRENFTPLFLISESPDHLITVLKVPCKFEVLKGLSSTPPKPRGEISQIFNLQCNQLVP